MSKSKWLLVSLLLISTILLTSCGWFNQAPVAQISVSTTSGEAPLTVSFSGTSSYDPNGSISDYNWNFGDGDYHYGISTSHTYQNEGAYTATLIVTDRGGLTDSDSITVTVTQPQGQPPIAEFAYSPSNPVAGGRILFTSQASDPDGSIVSHNWDFGDGSSENGIIVDHTYNSQGTYDVTLTVTDDDDLSASKTKSISIQSGQQPPTNQPPVADFTYSPSSPEVGDTVNFDASSSSDPDGYIASYDWNFGDGYTGHGVSTTHSYNSQGTYNVTLTVTDNDSLNSQITRTISVSKGQESQEEKIKDAIDYWSDITRTYAMNVIHSDHSGSYSIEQICDIWDYSYSYWVYIDDPGHGQAFEWTPASETIQMNLRGDCDDFAVLLAASIEAIGGSSRVIKEIKPNEAHAYAEVALCNNINSQSCQNLVNYICQRYGLGGVHYYSDSTGMVWLNLDWQENHPGGKYWGGTRTLKVYPYNQPPSNAVEPALSSK